MKVFTYVYYFFRSAFLRGPINTIKLIAAESVYERALGISTSQIKTSQSQDFFHYQGASYLVLNRIFTTVLFDKKHLNFIDIGCGKGRPCFVAEKFGFNNLVGIDLDPELIAVANGNQIKYSIKRKESSFEFHTANALDYFYKNLPSVYFLFNPFNAKILENVLQKIISSTKSETLFVYMNPKYKAVFVEEKFEIVAELKTKRYLEAVVYKLKI